MQRPSPKPPSTHCKKGHRTVAANSYFYVDISGRTRRKCKPCTLLNLEKHRRVSGIKARKMRKKPRAPEGELTLEGTEMMRANRIAHLIDKKWKASTSWERADVQAEIDALRTKDPA
jgi:hypothetical protein